MSDISMATTTSVYLPPEIISKIVASIDVSKLTYPELADLWLTARLVSKQFSYEVSKAFRKSILPELTIDYWFSKKNQRQVHLLLKATANRDKI